ncbi:MAG: hypothetical protein ACR2KX_17480 [Chitinophagaceae bacterium]
MKLYLQFIPIFLVTYQVFAQPCYIQKGANIVKFENCNTDQIKAIEWAVRLYKKGASKTGNSYWGTIKRTTASEVMAKLKSEQDFELRFNAFIGKGRVQDDILTHFNPLGPIAIMDKSAPRESPVEENAAQLTDINEKAKDYLTTYAEVKRKLDVIIKGKASTPFDNYGNVFKEYTDNLKYAFKQISSLRNVLGKSTTNLMDKITKDVESINIKLNAANSKQEQLNEAFDSHNQNQSQNHVSTTLKNFASNRSLISNLPNKYKTAIQTVIESGNKISELKSSIPSQLTVGMNEQQKIYFKNFVEQINYYWSDMAYCFGLMSEGSIGYGYLDNNKILIDVTDQYYRDNVFKNAQIFETSNYNSSYSLALLDKANAAYYLFKLIEHEPNVTKQSKNNLLNYGLTAANMIYQEAIDGYQSKSVLTQKQEIISKIKQSLK